MKPPSFRQAHVGTRSRPNKWTARSPFLTFLIAAFPAFAQNYIVQDINIPEAAAGAQGLEGVFLRPVGRGRYPLALISHGSPRDPDERPQLAPQGMLPQMMEFARHGRT
jgi:hypothetical protein